MTTRTTPNKTSFNGGEFSPLMAGREDLPEFNNSCRVMENMIGTLWGPAMRRPGTRFIVEVKDSSKFIQLMDFEYSEEQAYQIEAGAGYFRFFMNQGQIVVPNTDAAIVDGDFTAGISGWTNASTGTASISHDAVNGRLNLVGNGVDIAVAQQAIATTAVAQDHVIRFRVLGAAGDVVHLRIGTTAGGVDIIGPRGCPVGWYAVAFTPSASPFYVQFQNALGKTLQIDDVAIISGAPVENGTPYVESDLERIARTQSADVMYLTHPDRAQMKLERRGHTDWALVEIDFIDGPYLPENIDTSLTLTPSATTGLGQSLTASAALFKATDVGRLVRIKYGASWGYARIVAYASATVVTIDIKTNFGAITPSATWRLGMWSYSTGFPTAVTFHQERLMFGDRSARICGSKQGDYENHTPGVADDDPLVLSLLANKSQAIRWLVSDKNLKAGTQTAEAVIRGATATAALTPTNVDRDFETNVGSALVAPVETAQATLFIQRHGRKLQELAYSLQKDGLTAPDMTIRASHVTKTGLKQLAYQKEPWTVIWGRRTDGLLVGMTYERDEKVIGWHRHPVGGSFGGGGAMVESISTIPGVGRDELWMVVKRTINGVTRRYIEMLEAHLEDDDNQSDAFYVDGGATYSGAAATVISGLDHLEGETVKILADGAAHPDAVVIGGRITLAVAVTKAQIGLKCPWVLDQRIVAGSREGTPMGKKQRIDQCDVMMHRSLDVKMGPDASALEEINFREVGQKMDAPVPLYSGFKKIKNPGGYKSDAPVYLTGDGPFPATILAIVPRVGVDEG